MVIELTEKKLAQVHDGLTVADMPGSSPMDKSLNFSLFKRGRLSRAYVTASPQERAAMNGHGNNAVLAIKHARKAL